MIKSSDEHEMVSILSDLFPDNIRLDTNKTYIKPLLPDLLLRVNGEPVLCECVYGNDKPFGPIESILSSYRNSLVISYRSKIYAIVDEVIAFLNKTDTHEFTNDKNDIQ